MNNFKITYLMVKVNQSGQNDNKHLQHLSFLKGVFLLKKPRIIQGWFHQGLIYQWQAVRIVMA